MCNLVWNLILLILEQLACEGQMQPYFGGITIPQQHSWTTKTCIHPFKSLSDDCKMELSCDSGGRVTISHCTIRGYTKYNSVCVKYGNMDFSCRAATKEIRTLQCLQKNVTFLSDSQFCHLYYDCTDPAESKVCPYPKLFSTDSSSCEYYKNVNCGARIELKAYCQYNPITCSHCIPCEVLHPSCDGYTDGIHINPNRGLPNYMVCDGERLVKAGLCKMEWIEYA